MKGRMNTGLGEIVINPDVIALYAGSVAVECFGIVGNNVSHSHRRSNKMWKSNVKSVKVKVDGVPQKMYVCTSCLRSGKVERA